MLYFADMKSLQERRVYYVEIDSNSERILAKYNAENELFIELHGNREWPSDSNGIRVYGPLEVRRLKKPAKVERPEKFTRSTKVELERRHIQGYIGGVSLEEIAKDLKIDAGTVRSKLIEIGVFQETRKEKPKLTYNQLVAYGQNKSLAEIAKIGKMTEVKTKELIFDMEMPLSRVAGDKFKIYRSDKVEFELNRQDVVDYCSGAQIVTLAKRYGTSKRIIKSKLDDVGVLRNEDLDYFTLTNKQLIAIIKNESVKSIATIGGTTKTAVKKAMIALGINFAEYERKSNK